MPTTAGAGSEATRYSVIYYNEKQSLVHDSIFPNLVIVDPSFLDNLPEYHRKATILDAFVNSGRMLGKRSTEASKEYSRKAIILFLVSYPYMMEHPIFIIE